MAGTLSAEQLRPLFPSTLLRAVCLSGLVARPAYFLRSKQAFFQTFFFLNSVPGSERFEQKNTQIQIRA